MTITSNSNVPITQLKTKSIIKTEPVSLLNSISKTRITSTPVSILKPQVKAVNLLRQNLTSLLKQNNALSKPLELDNGLKPLVTAKLKQSVNTIMKSINKKPVAREFLTMKQESLSNANKKPLGSSENPIQIIQQGDKFVR